MSTPWVEAWHEALYGTDGFYTRDEPHAHFSTATSPSLVDALARAVVALTRQEELTGLVDIAAGGGELASAVCALAPELEVTCVEVRPRPAELPTQIRWIRSPGGANLPDELHSLTDVLVLAHEWLDNVPCVIAERTDTGLREVCVGQDGAESLGAAVGRTDHEWASQWWPQGTRMEIGRARDRAWAELLSRIERGLAVAVDYGHTLGTRPHDGSLRAYRSGAVVDPVPDGSCDLTAHVAVDSLDHDRIVTQRDLFGELAVVPPPPDRGLAHDDPATYLRALATRSAATALVDPAGLGAFWWVLRRA